MCLVISLQKWRLDICNFCSIFRPDAKFIFIYLISFFQVHNKCIKYQKGLIRKKNKNSFIVHICLGKYSFRFDTFLKISHPYLCPNISTSLSTYLIYIYIFTNSSARAGYDTRSIFKQSLTGLNSVFLLLDKLPHQGWRT